MPEPTGGAPPSTQRWLASWLFPPSVPWRDRALTAIVVVVAVTFAAVMLAANYASPELLWRDFIHDRNSHYGLGLDLALAVRTLDPVWFLSELEKAKVWPPLHGLVLSGVLLIGGIDHRLGIVPSLAGWVMTVSFVWLIARRLFSQAVPGLFAATVAVTLTIASPAFRLIASDVILEGLGAGLTALGLWAYLRASSEPENSTHWRVLALTLTALFFHKGNYWGFLAVSLAITFASEHAWRTIDLARSAVRRIDLGAAAKAAARDPLLVVFVILTLITACLLWLRPADMVVLGQRVRFYPPGNLITVAYAVLFIWAARIWKRHRAGIDTALGTSGRAMFYWHLAPIAVSFLLPSRLSAFLWFVGPLNTMADTFSPLEGVRFYWQHLAESFHVAPWMATLAIALAVLAATQVRRMTPGARVIFIFLLVATAAILIHPQKQGRFLGSWIFVLWIAAGAGAGVVLQWTLGRLRAVQALVAAAAATLLIAAAILHKPSAAAYATAIRPTPGPSDIDLIRPYLRELDGLDRVGFVTTFGASGLFQWFLHERCRCKMLVERPHISVPRSRDEVRGAMTHYLTQTRATRIVVIDAPGSRYRDSNVDAIYEKMAGIVDVMETQDRFVRGPVFEIPTHGARATIWHRR